MHAWHGQVRDFTFSPDTGRITHLSYDTFGLPTIPEALLNVYEVDAEAVLEVRSGLVVLKRGAERAVILVSTGLLGYALDKAKVWPSAPSAPMHPARAAPAGLVKSGLFCMRDHENHAGHMSNSDTQQPRIKRAQSASLCYDTRSNTL